MNARFALGAVAAALALFSVAPASAACRSSTAIETRGSDHQIDTRTRACAQWGIYADGFEHEVVGTVAGPGSRVVTSSIGSRTRTRLDSQGFDNRIGTVARSGGQIDVFTRGDDTQMALRAKNGSRMSVLNRGSGNYIRAEAN